MDGAGTVAPCETLGVTDGVADAVLGAEPASPAEGPVASDADAGAVEPDEDLDAGALAEGELFVSGSIKARKGSVL